MKKPTFALLALALAFIGVGAFAFAGHSVPADLMGAALAPDALNSLGLAAALPFAGKTKFFRVATEGATTDGRRIERNWIEQMAKNFDPKKYGARVWLEHFRGIFPDGPFRAYGDVTAVEARPVEDGKLALFAQIEPSPDLVKIVNDHLVEMLGGTVSDLDLGAVPPVVILMVGLQGSGKTTSSAKIAYRLSQGPQGMAAEMFGGTFATEDQLTTALSFMLGTLRATREKEARHE